MAAHQYYRGRAEKFRPGSTAEFRLKTVQNLRSIEHPKSSPSIFAVICLFRCKTPLLGMTSTQWPRKARPSLSWQHLSASHSETTARWRVVWDTLRKPEHDGRNVAFEKDEATALERARHMLRMRFVVYEIREPSGTLFLAEDAIRQRLGLSAAAT
jgi:hypothetical protein